MAQVPKLDSQVISGYFVHLDLALIHVIRTENNEDGIFALLAPMSKISSNARKDTVQDAGLPDNDSITTEQL